MGKNNPRTKFLSNKKQKASKLGLDVSGIKISNKLTNEQLRELDNRLNEMIRSVKPDYTPRGNAVNAPRAPRPKKPQKPKRSDSASNLVKKYKQLREVYINSIPDELKGYSAINKYFTEGEFLVNERKMYDLYAKGYTMLNFNSVKDFKEYYGTKSQKKLERLLKNEINQIENNMYERQVKDMVNQIEKRMDDFKKDNQELSSIFEEKFKKEIGNMNLIQLMEISNKLENVNNVFDSIYNSLSSVTDEPFERTIEITLKIAKKVDLKDYGN